MSHATPLLLLSLLLLVSIAERVPCVFKEFNQTDPDFPFKAEFDITYLTDNDYQIKDSRTQFNMIYKFAFCRNVAQIPESCKYPEPRAIYQMGSDTQGCIAAGGDYTNHTVTLMDNHDPSLGFSLMYINGDDVFCYGYRRQTAINFLCDPTSYSLPTISAVQEPGPCSYAITVRSIFACPTSCSKGSNILCSGRGVCRFDTDIGTPHCFCNTGSWGSACQNIGEEIQIWNPVTYSLIGSFSFLTLVLITMIGIWMKVKKLKLDPSVYTTLKNAVDGGSTPYQQL